MRRPLILISNDDGFRAEGIQVAAKALSTVGQVVVVAPEGEQSATSHSLTLHRPLRIRRQSPHLYSVDGTPTDCILLAVHEILKRRPDLVVSGINHGPNLGDDVHYSGTVSAALEGALMGIRSVAFSLVLWQDRRPLWPVASLYARRLSRWILNGGVPDGAVFNVNIPNVRRVCGVEMTRLGKRNYGEVIIKKRDPRGRDYFWIGGDEKGLEREARSDCNAILDKKVSVTPLIIDLTNHSFLRGTDSWTLP